jgi:hypothetical protein
MTSSTLTRLAGPAALAAGALMVTGELVILPFDVTEHVATSTNAVFQAGQVIYFLGFVALAVFLLASSRLQDDQGGRLGVTATVAALIGTLALGGDLWFETFAVPWIAEATPAAFDSDPSVLLALGAISSYLLFAVGWALFGIAALRSRVYPAWAGVALAIGGVVGFQALLSPYGVPLGLAVGGLGVWLLRRRSGEEQAATPRRVPASVG